MRGQVSLETLMVFSIGIVILSLILTQVNGIKTIGETFIEKKNLQLINSTINSLCKSAKITNSKQELELIMVNEQNISIQNKYCEEKNITLEKGRNKIIFEPGNQIIVTLTSK